MTKMIQHLYKFIKILGYYTSLWPIQPSHILSSRTTLLQILSTSKENKKTLLLVEWQTRLSMRAFHNSLRYWEIDHWSDIVVFWKEVLQGQKNGLEARHAYRISKWLQLVFEVQDYDWHFLLIIVFHMVVINVCLYNKIYYVWFADISQCHSVLGE